MTRTAARWAVAITLSALFIVGAVGVLIVGRVPR